MVEEDQEELFPDLANEEPVAEAYPSAFLIRAPDAPILTAVRIEGLKGFNDCEVKLAPLTVLTGPNNSGKSTVLALSAFDAVWTQHDGSCVPPAGP